MNRTRLSVSRLIIHAFLFVSLLGAFFVIQPTAPAQATGSFMYVLNATNIIRASLDGTNVLNLGGLNPGLLNNPRDIELDVPNNQMYIVNEQSVVRANLDGSHSVSLGNLGGSYEMQGFALDLVHKKMYVITQMNSGTVEVANLDGTGHVSLGTLGSKVLYPYSIALDVPNNKMYILNSDGTVIRANLNGTNAVRLNGDFRFWPPLDSASSFALDLIHQKMYVGDSISNYVIQANLDTTGVVSFGNLGSRLHGVSDIALDVANNKMYITNYSSYTVVRANLDGTGAVTLGNLGGTLKDTSQHCIGTYSSHNDNHIHRCARWRCSGNF